MNRPNPQVSSCSSSRPAPDAICLSGVSFRRGQTWILNDIDWRVPAGACAAILGPNGSGKSTLTRILACHSWPTQGVAQILSQEFGHSNLLEIRKQIRLVQAAGPYDVDPELTTRQVILTGFFSTIGLYDPTTPAMDDRADFLLDQIGLSHVREHAYGTLSSGERVRGLIARALAVPPRLLLLDEPTSGLDLLAREQVLATIEMMFRSEFAPPTVVLITHHVEELPPATSHVLLLDQGRAAAQGPPADVLRQETLSAVYRCPLNVRQTNGRYYVEVHPHAWEKLLKRNGNP